MSVVCVSCRTLLGAGESCDPAHEVVSLADPSGRKRLADTVWAGLRAGDAGGSSGGGQGAGVGGLLLDFVAGLARERDDARRPAGARLPMPRPSGKIVEGTVDGAPLLAAPASGTPCVAFALELRHPHATFGQVVLRIATTAPFTLVVRDGEPVDVEAGRIWMEAWSRCRTDRDRILEYLAASLPGGIDYNGEALFPFADSWETVVRPGDRVRLVADLELRTARVAPVGGEAAYRTAEPQVLAPRGVPWLRRIG